MVKLLADIYFSPLVVALHFSSQNNHHWSPSLFTFHNEQCVRNQFADVRTLQQFKVLWRWIIGMESINGKHEQLDKNIRAVIWYKRKVISKSTKNSIVIYDANNKVHLLCFVVVEKETNKTYNRVGKHNFFPTMEKKEDHTYSQEA
ncbi:hypothetical protein SADUNF_Sadunf01G0170000 [Salix dunnii]|uniref:Uncharacterized protein n=1 Tax=Salix dunnii TaxID=1413687 RepID=A0A835NBZ7_9ROSI|nr:hypothetical protein SADUNF_Sadunf01G0170000 [Salix dunnii]